MWSHININIDIYGEIAFQSKIFYIKEAEDGEEVLVEGLARVVEDILQLRASIRATLH